MARWAITGRFSMRILNALLLSIWTPQFDQIALQTVKELYYNLDSFILYTDHYRTLFLNLKELPIIPVKLIYSR